MTYSVYTRQKNRTTDEARFALCAEDIVVRSVTSDTQHELRQGLTSLNPQGFEGGGDEAETHRTVHTLLNLDMEITSH